MKSTLQAGKTYCVKFYVNNYNGNPCGISAIGAYFGGSEIDTIHYCNIPLTYLVPQIQNPQNNIITDTLNWVAITGTFTANGTEKYLVLGNFLSDENTDTLMINPAHLPTIYTNLNIDDVSCIPIDLEAYAGRDTTILIGDSVYIGRERDFAIDSGCVWYKLPSTTAIDTISGMWVNPALGTHTYVVRQELECSGEKWDTVVVKVVDGVGLNEYAIGNMQVEVFPNPASESLTLTSPKERSLAVSVYDLLGKEIMREEIKLKNGKGEIDVSELLNGIYFVVVSDQEKRSVTKKLIIAK